MAKQYAFGTLAELVMGSEQFPEEGLDNQSNDDSVASDVLN